MEWVKAKMKAKTVSEGPSFCATHHVVKLAKMVLKDCSRFVRNGKEE